MRLVSLTFAFAAFTTFSLVRAAEPLTQAAKISLDESGVLVVDGKKIFPLNLTVIPGPDAKSPSGKPAYSEFADSGIFSMRTGGADWNEQTIQKEKSYQDAAAASGMRCSPWLGWDLSNFPSSDKKKEAELKQIIDIFKVSPGMGMWKGADEPDWGNSHNPKASTPEEVANVARLIHENDPNHPIWLVQAPRGTVATLKRYDAGWDVGGIDIYPISYPPGVHSEEKNKEISMVGDFTRMMKQVAGKKPFWMTLQIAFSGVVKPGQTLRFPTFPEQRFMAYEAIINGSRGLTYFGGGLPQTLNERDKQFGFNWTYYDKVMRPLFEEIGPKSPILPALVAPDSKIKLKVVGEAPAKRQRATKAEENKKLKQNVEPREMVEDRVLMDASAMEFLVRETESDVFVLACKKEGATTHVRFSGLPDEIKSSDGTVVFEEPRSVKVENGSFTDWFGPFEVHVYKFSRK